MKLINFLSIATALVFSVNLHAQILPGTYKTSWIGNTEGIDTEHIMQGIDQFYVAPNGYVAAITGWDEGGHNVMGFSTDGKLQCDPQDCGTGSWGRMSGKAITYDGTYVYQAMDQGSDGSKDDIKYPASGTWKTIARYDATGRNNSYAPFANGKGHALHSIVLSTDGADPKGLVTTNNELFVAVGDQMRVYQLPLASQNTKRTWTISDPGQLQVDAEGYIWMLQPSSKKIIRYSTTGVLQPQSISLSSILPTGFGIDNVNSKIYVTNNNIDQNILIYSNIGSTPVPNGTFGVKGGIFAGVGVTIGTTGPLRFNSPIGVGVDKNGNIYVACNGSSSGGGAVIEKYNASSNREWQKYGIAFVDCADIAPSSETDVFTKEEHFVLNYNNTVVGTEQNYKGYTVNPFKYPQDARYHTGLAGGVWIREFNGKRFLFMTDMYSSYLAVYRFNAATDGEIAIPCGFFAKSRYSHEGGTWPANQPASNAWIWRDNNGNGNFDSGEYTSHTGDFSSWGWNVDSKGTVWLASEASDRNIFKFPCQGLDANGSPIYNYNTMTTNTASSVFTEMQRLEYDAANDQMYIGGYTDTNPHIGEAWGRLGREIVRIDNWGTGNRNPAKRIVLPNDAKNDAAIKDMSVAGDYLFTINCFGGLVDVYDKVSGTKVGTISPQGIGGFGWVDMPASLRAYKRSNGEYILFVEEDGFLKVVMYRWCPTGNCKEILTANNEKQQTENLFTLHPNPAETELFVTGNLSENANYEITSMEGKSLQTGALRGSNISIENLKVGCYLIKIKTEAGDRVQRFVKE